MDRLKFIKCFALSVLSISAYGCGFERFDDSDHGLAQTPVRNTLIRQLRVLYDGGVRHIEDDLVFVGSVTANDRNGNFYRSFVVQDTLGAVEVLAGFYDSHAVYGIDREVVIRAKGLSIGEYGGVIRLGRAINDYSGYRIEEFGSAPLLREYIRAGGEYRPKAPSRKRISGLHISDCGELVSIAGVMFHRDTVVSWAGEDALRGRFANGVHQFKDGAGDSLLVVTSSYCDFANGRVPTDSVSLTGILMYGSFNNSEPMFALKMRSPGDVEAMR